MFEGGVKTMYLNEFVEDCSARGLTPETIETYRSNINHFLNFSGKDPTRVEMSDLRAFLGHLRTMDCKVGSQMKKGVAPATMAAYFSAISSFYDFLIWENHTQANPVTQFRKRYLRLKIQRNGENSRQLISISKMMELIELCLQHGDICAWALIFFAAKTGLRKGELLALRVQDLNFETGSFTIAPKAKRSNRLGFLDGETVHVLQQYLDWREVRALDEKALWVTSGGYPLDKNGPYNIVTQYASMLDIHDARGPLNKKFTPHCCRHFFTTHMRRAGMPREFIQELRGDSRGEAIDIYDHIDPEELQRSYLQHVPKLLRIDTKQSTLIPFQ
jgi:integrase/recombinase XerD